MSIYADHDRLSELTIKASGVLLVCIGALTVGSTLYDLERSADMADANTDPAQQGYYDVQLTDQSHETVDVVAEGIGLAVLGGLFYGAEGWITRHNTRRID